MAAESYLVIRCWDDDYSGLSFAPPPPSPGPPVTSNYDPNGRDNILGKNRDYVMEVLREGSRFFVLSKTYRAGILVDTPNTSLDVGGDFAVRFFDDIVINSGQYDDYDASAVSALRITGASGDFTLTGFASGNNGKELLLYNATAFTMTLANESSSSVAANRVTTFTGTDISIIGQGTVLLKYDDLSSRWLVIDKNGIVSGTGSSRKVMQLSGTVNGDGDTGNNTFTFSPAPFDSAQIIIKNRVELRQGMSYAYTYALVAGTPTITFQPGYIPQTDDYVTIDFNY